MYFGFSVAEQMEDSPSMKAGYVVKSSLLPEFKHKFEAFFWLVLLIFPNHQTLNSLIQLVIYQAKSSDSLSERNKTS